MPGPRHHRREALHCCPACAASVLGRPRRRAGRPPPVALGDAARAGRRADPAGGDGGRRARRGAGGHRVAGLPDPRAGPRAAASPRSSPTSPPPRSRPPGEAGRGVARQPGRRHAQRRAASRTASACRHRASATTPTTPPPSSPRAAPTAPGARRAWCARSSTSAGGGRARHPKQPRLGIGDLSRETAAPSPARSSGTQSHQNGLDVDIRLVRRDGARGLGRPLHLRPRAHPGTRRPAGLTGRVARADRPEPRPARPVRRRRCRGRPTTTTCT